MPRICPPPPDCPLYAQRLDYGTDEPLRRAVLMEHRRVHSLAALVWADFNRACQRPPEPSPTRPVPPRPALPAAPEPLPIFDHLKQKGATP